MANSYTQIYLQLVFAVKRRESLIHKSWREELYKYIIRYIQNQEEHHENKIFTREYIELLNQYQIEYHEKYLFENPN